MNPIFYSKVYKICKGKIATLTEFLNRNEVQQIAQTLISPSQNHTADYPKKGGDGDKNFKIVYNTIGGISRYMQNIICYDTTFHNWAFWTIRPAEARGEGVWKC